MALELSDDQLELLYGRTRSDLAEPAPAPLTDAERELLYGPMRAPVVPAAAPSGAHEDPAPRPRRRVLRRVARLLTSAIGALVGVLMMVLTVGPHFFAFQTFYIRSGSMRPGIPVGALVIATRAPASELHVGDIIVFDRPDHPGDVVTHRIVAIENSPDGPQFVTKGDANSVPDPWRVRAGGEGWRYQSSVPYAGFAVGYLHALLSGIGTRGAFVIIATVFALFAIWRTPKSDRETEADADVAAAAT